MDVHSNGSKGGGQDLHDGLDKTAEILDVVNSIKTDVASFMAADGPAMKQIADAKESLLGQIASFETAAKAEWEKLRIADRRLRPGDKFIAATETEERYDSLVGLGDTMAAAQNVFHDRTGRVDREMFKADQGGDTNQGGGALVPTHWYPGLIRVPEEISYARKLFQRVVMAGRKVSFPVESAAPLIYWPGEGSAPSTSTTLAFTASNPELVAKTAMAVSKITGELEDDSVIPLRPVLGNIWLRAMAHEENRVAFWGDAGGGDPFNGIGKTSGIANEDWSVAAGLTVDDIINGMGKLGGHSALRGAFICNKDFFFTQVMRVKEANQSVFIHNHAGLNIQSQPLSQVPDPLNGAFGLLMGRPIFLTDTLQAGTSNGHISMIYGDFEYAFMGDRRAIAVDFSEHVHFLAGATAMRLSQRIGFLYPIATQFCKFSRVA